MKTRLTVAVLAACSVLSIAAPVSAQFKSLKSFKKVLETAAEVLEEPKSASRPQPAARPTSPQAPLSASGSASTSARTEQTATPAPPVVHQAPPIELALLEEPQPKSANRIKIDDQTQMRMAFNKVLRFGAIQREVYYENYGDPAFGKTNPLALLHGDEYTVLITATEFENAGKFQPATINFLYLQYDSDLITGIIDNQEFEIVNNGAIEKFNISLDFADHPVVFLEESGGGSGMFCKTLNIFSLQKTGIRRSKIPIRHSHSFDGRSEVSEGELLDIEKNVGFFIKANRNIETEKSTESFVDFEKYNYNAGKFVSDSGISVSEVC